MHAITQRPAGMYHSWGSMNPWLRQIHSGNRLYLHRARAERLGSRTTTGPGVSRHGRIKAQVRLMDGVNPDTCWTWNAIGKRAGAWHLTPDAPGSDESVSCNHLIDELLPEREGGYRYANADPGNRPGGLVRSARAIERAPPAKPSMRAEVHPACARRPGLPARPVTSRYGLSSEHSDDQPARGPYSARRLGLVIDLDTCVGCQACWSAARNGMPSGHPAPLTDQDPYGADPHGAWLNRVHGYEVGEGEGSRTGPLPRSCLHCEHAACVTVCPTGPSYKRAEDGIVLVDPDTCIGCGLCAWGCPYGAREETMATAS